jgi:hypothetical protein
MAAKVTLTSLADPKKPLTASFDVVVPAQRLAVREVVEAARRILDPEAAETACLRAWSAALIIGVPDLAEMFKATTGHTLASCGRSAAALGDVAYDWFSSVHYVEDAELVNQGSVVVTEFNAVVMGWARQREEVVKLGKSSGATAELGTGASTG